MRIALGPSHAGAHIGPRARLHEEQCIFLRFETVFLLIGILCRQSASKTSPSSLPPIDVCASLEPRSLALKIGQNGVFCEKSTAEAVQQPHRPAAPYDCPAAGPWISLFQPGVRFAKVPLSNRTLCTCEGFIEGSPECFCGQPTV